VLDIARGGLQRLGCRRSDGRDESVYLEPLAALVEAGVAPAQQLIAEVAGVADERAAIVAATRVA
jgi:glutamate--cysteine ligase